MDDDADEGNRREEWVSESAMANAERLLQKCGSKIPDLSDDFWKAFLFSLVADHYNEPQLLGERMDQYTDAESIIWMRQQMRKRVAEEDTVYEPFDNAAITKFDDMQVMLGNTGYQCEDIPGSCSKIHLQYQGENTVYRMPGMAPAKELEFWQVPVVRYIMDKKEEEFLRGVILADGTGLEKTWLAIAVMIEAGPLVCQKLPAGSHRRAC